MFKKMMKHLANNPSLKILSVAIAVVLWLVVVNYDNPEVTQPFRIPVDVVGEETLASMEMVYDIVDNSNVATIYATGKRKMMDELHASDFKAVADLSQIDFYDDAQVKLVPINVSVSNRRYQDEVKISSQATVNMKVTLEELSTMQKYVGGTTSGEPAEGYAIGNIDVSPNLINISGPQSLVSRVSRIGASVNVDGLTEDVRVSVTPVLYDDNGEIVESSQIKLSQDKVTVEVQILGTKTVPVECGTTGTPMEGYRFIAPLEYAPDTVTIKGKTSDLNNIQRITIPKEAIDLEGVSRDVESSIDITPYLPEGISLVNPEENKIAVRALIEKLETKNLELPLSDLEVLNLAEGLEVTYNTSVLNIPVRGRSEELDDLTLALIRASIDLNDLEPGIHWVDVNVVLDPAYGTKYELTGTVTLQVTIGEIGADNGEEGTDGDGSGTGSGGTGTGSDENGGSGIGAGTGSSGTGTGGTGGGTGGAGSGGSGGTGSGTGGGTGTGGSDGNRTDDAGD